YGPLLYLFVHFLTIKNPVFKPKQLLHFIPFVLFFLTDFLLIVASRQSLRGDWPIAELIVFELLVIHLLSYNIKTIQTLKNYRSSILQVHSCLEEKDLRWLYFLVMLLTGTYALSFSVTHLLAFGIKSAGVLYVLIQVLLTAIIYLMSYRMLFTPSLFLLSGQGNKETAQPEGSTAPIPEKYQRSGLTNEQAENYALQLETYMQDNKPYLDPDLSIYSLAEKLNVSRNHLTEVINEILGQNFYEFVNTYRVEEVKKLLTDPRHAHLNLAALGLEAGFKSKTAFNTNFKKFTGTTPSIWKRNASEKAEITLKEVLT
ncbi:MAG: helix-turn-helix domain-containing protein, partial [Hymenobacteraceae bacterium]|nr:helix-turn-helix domain-containing protein [Hymenobacteraceae bacterium]